MDVNQSGTMEVEERLLNENVHIKSTSILRNNNELSIDLPMCESYQTTEENCGTKYCTWNSVKNYCEYDQTKLGDIWLACMESADNQIFIPHAGAKKSKIYKKSLLLARQY